MILFAALACCAFGLAWLALAMDVHWQQVRGSRALSAGTARLLRVLGAAALLASFILCFVADHATMAPLVWVMALAAAALTIAFILAWRPGLLGFLVSWLPAK